MIVSLFVPHPRDGSIFFIILLFSPHESCFDGRVSSDEGVVNTFGASSLSPFFVVLLTEKKKSKFTKARPSLAIYIPTPYDASQRA